MVHASVGKLCSQVHVDGMLVRARSDREELEVVSIGYPVVPRGWRTACGLAFGVPVKAKPVLSLPACHKMMCDKCLRAER